APHRAGEAATHRGQNRRGAVGRPMLSGFIRVNVSGVRIDSRTELVVAADVAERLGISRARVSVLASRSDFPKPVGRLGRSYVWPGTGLERWARATGRLGQSA